MSDRSRLIRKRKQLLALLPLVTAEKGNQLRDEIALIEQAIGRSPSFAPDLRPSPTPESAAGVNGVGGLEFQYESPPGAGRLVRIPFLLYQADWSSQANFVAPDLGPMCYTASGANSIVSPSVVSLDETNPLVSFTMPNNTTSVSGFFFRTPIIEWAKLRVVGLEVTKQYASYSANDAAVVGGTVYPSPTPGTAGAGYVTATGEYNNGKRFQGGIVYVLVKNLNVGGGANLLSQEGFVDSMYYDSRVAGFAGLRAYPELLSPNRAFVEVAFSGQALTGVTFSMNLLCDMMEDTEYGTYNPGPYNRPATMRRMDIDQANEELRS